MSIQFTQRSYGGKSFRPTPEIHFDASSRLLIVATPWGPRAAARKVIDRMTDYLALAREDREVTSPFQRLSCLSGQANNLRVAALLANETIFRGENRSEYLCGVELFAACLNEDEFIFVQAGHPQAILLRAERTPTNLAANLDLSFDISDTELLPPLPSNMLGLDSSVNFAINSFRARPSDRIILLSHSLPPDFIFTQNATASDFEQIVRLLAAAHTDLPFWLGELTINSIADQEAA